MHFFFLLQNDNLYGLLMNHNTIVPFYFKKGSKGGQNSGNFTDMEGS